MTSPSRPNFFLRALERCCGALSKTTAIFPNLRFISVTYRMNVSALNSVPCVLKNHLPSSVTAPYTVTFLWLPVYGAVVLIPAGDQYLRPALMSCVKKASSSASITNPAAFRREIRLFARHLHAFIVLPSARLTCTMVAALGVRPYRCMRFLTYVMWSAAPVFWRMSYRSATAVILGGCRAHYPFHLTAFHLGQPARPREIPEDGHAALLEAFDPHGDPIGTLHQ